MAPVTANEFNVYESAEARFEEAAKRLGLEDGLYRYMKYPNKEITVYIPVTLDNGKLEVFTGYRVHHSIVRGPCKGGIRFDKNVTLDEVRALSPISSYLLEMSIAAIKEDRPSQQQPRYHSDQKYS